MSAGSRHSANHAGSDGPEPHAAQDSDSNTAGGGASRQTPRNRIVVAGAGVAGLAAGYRIATSAPDVALQVLEADKRSGGLIATTRRHGFVIERGPEAMLSDKPWGVSLARRLGLTEELMGTRSGARGAYVVARGKLERIPDGFSMLAPSRLGPLLSSHVLSLRGKLRACWDLWLPRGGKDPDESVQSFVSRRFGKEVLDRLVEPLAGGVYGADPAHLSLRATVPRFAEIETRNRSVVRGLQQTEGDPKAAGARYSLFVTLRSGMQTLTDELAERIGPNLRRSAKVSRIGIEDSVYRLELDNGERFQADRVVVALPAHAASSVLRELDPELSSLLGSIVYSSAAIASFSWPLPAVPRRLDAFGWVAPGVENRTALACTWSSVKFDHRAPEGHLLLRVFFGGPQFESLVRQRDDEELLALARAEVQDLMGIRAEPGFEMLDRYPLSMPQYNVGHLKLVRRVEQRLARHKGLSLAGNAYRGVGIPDAIRSGEAAAEAVLAPWL